MASDETHDGPGGVPNRQTTFGGREAAPSADHRRRRGPIRLHSKVVSPPRGPDRRTVYPPQTAGVARMSTWLTADCDAFVDLEEIR